MRFLPKIFRAAVKTGRLELLGPDGFSEIYGDGGEPKVSVRITDPGLDWKIFLNSELKATEAYMDGGLVIEQGTIHDFISLFFHNKKHFDLTPSQIFWRGLARRFRRVMQHNPIARASANVKHHYDLGNDFYRLWLDDDLQYSCGYWEDGVETLEAAQVAKKRHIAAKLALEPGQRVLDSVAAGAAWRSIWRWSRMCRSPGSRWPKNNSPSPGAGPRSWASPTASISACRTIAM